MFSFDLGWKVLKSGRFLAVAHSRQYGNGECMGVCASLCTHWDLLKCWYLPLVLSNLFKGYDPYLKNLSNFIEQNKDELMRAETTSAPTKVYCWVSGLFEGSSSCISL